MEQKIVSLTLLLKQIIQDVEQKKIAIAVSGGSDSIFLLTLCAEISIDILVYHVNHQTRPDCQQEETFIINYCERLGVPYKVLYAKNLDLSMTNFEKNARVERYRLLQEQALNDNVKTIFTAHHQDDVLENVFLKVLRGSLNIFIPAHRSLGKGIELVRPILGVTKQEIIKYLDKQDISYLDDSSNQDTRYLRNFLRLMIFPLLFKKISGLREKLLSLVVQRKEEEEFFNIYIKHKINEILSDDSCSIEELIKEHHTIQLRILQALIILYFSLSISRKQLLEILSILNRESSKRQKIFICNKGSIIRERGRIFFLKNHLKTLEKKVFIVHNKRVYSKILDWKVELVLGQGICYNLDDTIFLQKTKKNDTIAWGEGTKKISKIIQEQKIPLAKRENAYLIQKNQVPIGLIIESYIYIIPKERVSIDQKGLFLKSINNDKQQGIE